ncbi:carbohydrate kinase [Actinocatenispora rupis]|uniref:Ribokinase n=1 Tax=Actinocatenispora rupis TaxID=519421 RepID=A0A8J3NHS6_9ACTN|nr:ribokinase [Actinocatenispora rupis]
MFTVIGESLVDVVYGRAGAPPTEHVGGSPANVALGLARLGDAVGLVTQFGRDVRGERVEAHLTRAGVTLTGSHLTDRATATATARLAADGSAAYEFDLRWDPATLAAYPGSVAVHTGSLGTLAPGGDVLADLLGRIRRDTVVSYDPNVRPDLHGTREYARAQVERFVRLAHLVKASGDDVAWLYPGEPVADVVARWLAAGPSLVVVTEGGAGARLATPGYTVELPAPPVTVVDTVGAGDSVTSALLDGLYRHGVLTVGALPRLAEETATEVLRRALRAAAITCGRPGADPPTDAELAAAT